MKPEILSPAGSAESLQAALRAGADAVYFGLSQFNARKNADNFSADALVQAVCDCHRQNVKVYVTLNTLISDDELPAAMSSVKLLCLSGVDGVIVQDLGLAALIRQAAPDLRLHASTQLSVHSPAALPLLKTLGFSRVVAAREMSFCELKEFCARAAELNIEVEVFVHGALCMCVSGQCYLSAVLGGRSGNRGLCAQPCRLPFSAQGGTGHDLSLKDLSLIRQIDRLGKIGVASLKIEGRMKRPEYTAAATAACRSFLDSGTVPDGLMRNLGGIFSRNGFTNGYLAGTPGRAMFGIRTDSDAALSAETAASLHALYRAPRQCIPLTADFTEADGQAVLCVCDGNHTITAAAPLADSDRELSAEFVKSKLGKLGGTNYFLQQISVSPMKKYISAGALGELRKSVVSQLDQLRGAPMPRLYHDPVYVNLSPRYRQTAPKLIARFDRAEQMPARTDGIFAVSLPLESDFSVLPPLENTEKWIDMPRGLFGAETWARKRLAAARAQGFTAALCGNLAAVELVREAGLSAVGDFGLNLYNSQAVDTAAHLGVSRAVLSPELTLAQINRISAGIPVGAIVYGRLPLMLTRNCPVKNGLSCADCKRGSGLTDRKGIFFPVRCRKDCAELLNSVPIWMADRLNELEKLDFLILYFTTESAQECESVLSAYHTGGRPQSDFTRGLFYRGVE